MDLLAILLSSFIKYLFEPFAHSKKKNGWFVFLLSWMSSLYILGRSPLTDTCVPNIFPQLVACLFIL